MSKRRSPRDLKLANKPAQGANGLFISPQDLGQFSLLSDGRNLELLYGERPPVDRWRERTDRNRKSPLKEGIALHKEREQLRQHHLRLCPKNHRVSGADAVEFGDAELASLVAPRALIVEACRGPEIPQQVAFARGVLTSAAPGRLTTPTLASVRAEFDRAKRDALREMRGTPPPQGSLPVARLPAN